VRPRTIGSSARPHARAAILALLPLLAGCTLAGYPAPAPTGPPAAPRASSTPEDASVTAANAPAASATPATRGEYEVQGERYEVLASSEGYRDSGVASWYGAEFAGRPTSSGEIYDPSQLTGAHRNLPLNSWVQVTNLANGRKVNLRINDRGPFKDTHLRIIDVSWAAARDLGMLGTGLARVEVVALPTGSQPPGS
jgi:rare lipoprotein A